MYQIVIVLHVLVGAAVIGLVLIQHGRGADAGAAFGSGASGTVFGSRGAASFLTRATAVCAVLFFSSSLFLAYLSGDTKTEDLMDAPPAIEEEADLPAVSPDDLTGNVDTSDLPIAVEKAEKAVGQGMDSKEKNDEGAVAPTATEKN